MPTHSLKSKRLRYRHPWQQTYLKSSVYALQLGEKVNKGRHTRLEYFLLASIIQFTKDVTINFDQISIIYHLCVLFASKSDLTLPLSTKKDEEIEEMIKMYLNNLDTFKALYKVELSL